MRWYRFGTDFFVCDCEKLKMYWMYIEFFGKKQAGKDVPKMCRRINQRFLNFSLRLFVLPLVTVQVGDGDTVGNFLRRTALALPVHEVCHRANFCFPHPSRTFKTCIVNESERYSVEYLLSLFQKSQRC